ncbi:MAG: helix-turn-helix domain-containing protein [Oscillospiraceae bacterium]|nr:helix-turn-helix domain-containing protein [Oscillospiraceae bacterium]
MELGKKIRQLRFKARLTQEQLAEKLGVGPQAVSKWENSVAMPDITALPLLAEVFGVSIDELFDLSAEQRFDRIENRMDIEEELPQDLFREYEDFLKAQAAAEEHKERATGLLAYLYWHRMESCSRKAARYAEETVRMAPDKKDWQWILHKAAGHAAWDWNMWDHTEAVDFWRQITEESPQAELPYLYLLDQLLADHRADEAEEVLQKFRALPHEDPERDESLAEVYRAHIALARFDAKSADAIMEALIRARPDDFVCLFEAAQYYARKSDYDRAIVLYERSFEKEPRRPRFQDELMAIAHIHQIRGDYAKAAETYDRIVALLRDEWGLTEDVTLKDAVRIRDRLREKAGA